MWSTGSGKMLGIPSLNTDTTTNEFCKSMYNSKVENLICRSCYSMSMLKTFRKNCTPKFSRNSKYLSEKVQDRKTLPICPSNTGRFSSHGELVNSNHLENLINICLNQPMTTFTLWTKKANWIKQVLDQRGKPKNLILIYSNPYKDKIVKDLPKYFDKTFNNVTTDLQEINCDGKCQECMM